LPTPNATTKERASSDQLPLSRAQPGQALARIVAERCNGHSAGCVGVISLTLQTYRRSGWSTAGSMLTPNQRSATKKRISDFNLPIFLNWSTWQPGTSWNWI